MIYIEVTELEHVKRIADMKPDTMVYYSVNTCWWVCDPPNKPPGFKTLQYQTDSGLPCDPRGGMLMQTDLAGFIQAAEENPDHYGRHGLRALMAAFHGNVNTDDMRPTCFRSWDEYNNLIDESDRSS